MNVALVLPAWGPDRISVAESLHPETSPDAIAADQQLVVHNELPSVRMAWKRFGAEPTRAQLIDSLSHATDLTRWTVERRLAELGHLTDPAAPHTKVKRRTDDERQAVVVAFLKEQKDYVTVEKIAVETELPPRVVRNIVCWDRGKLFIRRALSKVSHNGQCFEYKLREAT